MIAIETTFQRSSKLLLIVIILLCNRLLPSNGSISSQHHNKTRHSIPTAQHQPPSQLRSDRVSLISSSSHSNNISQVHKIKLIPKLLPFNSSELYFLRNSSRNNRYFYGDTKGDPGQRRFTSPQPSSFVQAPKNKPQQLSETQESFADRPMSYGNHFYPSWFPSSSESRNIKESKPILREPSHHREKEDLEDCRYDSVELRAQLADIIFTGTIKKQSKGRQHNFRNKRQVPSDRHKLQNQFYNPRSETNDIPGQNGRYISHKYSLNFTNVYSNQAASGDEFLKNSRQNDVKSNLVGGEFDNHRHEDKFKLPVMEVDFPNGSPLVKQVDDREFYDVAKVEIKRIIKGRELLEKHIFEDSSLSSGSSKYYGNQFVTIYGLNNPSICMGSASLFDTRIFPVKEFDDHLMLSFSMEKMSLSNLQQFDAAVSKAAENTRKHENVQNPKTQAISKEERTAVVQNPATKKYVATAPPFRKTETQQSPNKLQQLAIDIISEPSDQRIEERTSALFTCGAKTVAVGKDGVVRGISPIQIHPEIEWFRNYKEKLSNDPERKVFVRETKESPSVLSSVLRLEGVGSDKSGMIECRVSLRVWEQIEGGAWMDTGRKIKKSASTLLRVNKGISGSTGFPKINMNPQVNSLTVLLGKPLDLVCNAYARTPPKVKWLKNGLEHVKDELNERIHTASSGVLHFREVTEEDGKSYECRASNMVGTTSRSITLKVTNDPCDLMECKFGSTCQIDKITLEASCHCQSHCHSEGHKPMCSTEEVTFNNMCFLKQAECQEQRIIKVKSEGPCKADDPCENMDCLFGSKCLITFDGSPTCECPDECLDHDGGKVCGTDDQTYDNRCQLKRQSCIEQREIFVKFDGPCDPCQEVTCYYGSRCIPTSQHSASCQCTFDCSSPWKNGKVCATDGKTYLNECEMEKVGCLEQRSLEVQFQGACDPCEDFKCSFGAKCMTTTNGKPSCKCMHSCASGDGMKVCGTDRRTYDSVCHLEKASCVLMVEIGVQLQGACDPCAEVTCGFGSKCILDNKRNPECACLHICKEETYKVCGSDGRSYEGVCELEKRSCEQQEDIQIEFMGPCDPCEDHVCHYGGQCVVDNNNNRPICSCEEVCSDITDSRKLCGTDGVTYKDLCDMKRLSCDQQRDIKVNYTGPCDLCEDIVCKFGSKCVVDDGHHVCKCTETCENEFDPQKVCGFDGVTYPSICELERASCEEQREIKMEYLGSCDPCEDVTCNYGAKCELTPQGHPVCLCSTVCFEELSVEKKVCGTNGQTYSSRCALEKASCEEQREIRVDTTGPCDPCEDHMCHYGSQCVVDNSNRPICSCEEVCHDVTDNRKLCGTDGITYKNLCDMKRLSCDQQRDVKVNYTGSCDLCEDIACYFGSKCVVDDDGHHVCKCTETCENEFDPQKVCGFDGVTYPSICELERASCLEQREIKFEFMGPCDPCEEVECKFGSQCLVDDSRMAACYCSKACNASNMEKLCGSDGMTYENLCELEQTSCNEQRDIHINYVGPCDSCIEVNCHFGSLCQSDENNLPVCICPDDCDHSDEGQPVCGSDGVTYINTCLLELASCQEQRNIVIAFQGRCDPCDGFICSFGSKCSSDENGVPNCHCPQECDQGRGTKVCGNDGRTYANVCELERVACQERRNVEVKFEGPCDPCLDMECQENEQCQIDLNKIPSCKCPNNCSSELILPVCASNGLTYSSECVMEHEACLTGAKLRIITQGECTPANNLCMAGACDSFSKCEVDSSGAPRCFCPFSCELSFKPVCGSDGKTYENECHLEREACIGGVKIDKLYNGACDAKSDNTCRSITCGEDEVCVLKFGYKPECQCILCSQDFKPVCGSGMKTFTNECHLRRQRCLEKSNIEIEHVGRCDLCKDVQCDFHGVCNSTTGACECVCDSKDTVEVCASNGMTYPSECYVNMMSCHSRTELLVVHVGRCDQCLGVNCYYGAECQNGICSCKDDCQSEEGEVCGTDGLTYKSECHLELTSCQRQSDIQVSHVGTCHEKVESKPTTELGGSGGGDNDDDDVDDVGTDVVIVENDLDKETSEEGSGFEGSGRSSTSLKESLVTEAVDESSVDSSGNIYEGMDRTRREICTEENCNYGGRCEWNLIGQQFCNCQFKCDAVRSPVCGSDGKTYANECEMNEFSCKIQQEITVQSYEICDDFFEEICDGQTPLSDPKTNRPLDCLVSKRCPKNSYCHVSGHVARCCPEENVCKCHPLGSLNSSCNSISKQCPCKPGVIGKNCDRCNTNFWGIHKIQDETQGCLPCNCNKFGSERSDCEQTSGRCICLEGVTGQKCDKCANGKKLSKDGCVDERNRRSKPCPSEVTCRFGATCQMTPDGPQCVCPDSCSSSDRFFADGVVCGTDNKVYASKCQLELMTCRLQTDIKVLSYGPCPESRSQDDSPRKSQPIKLKQSGDEIHHVYPSFSSQSWMKLHKPQFGSNDVTLNFELKAAKTDGVIFYLGANDYENKDFIALSLRGGVVEFRYNFGQGYSVLKSSEKIRAGGWHKIVASKFGKTVLLTLDNQLPYTKRDTGSLHSLNLINHAYLGFPPGEESRSKVGLAMGFQGCIKSLIINSSHHRLDYQLHNYASSKDVEEISQLGNCKRSACAKFPCEHGGQCFDINDGKSFRCKCKEGFSGANCHIETVLFPCQTNPCLNDGTCVATDDGAYACNCPEQFSGHHCHIRRY